MSTAQGSPYQQLRKAVRRRVKPVREGETVDDTVRIEIARERIRPDLLVPSPVFVFSTLRSGSTLLRMMLNSHSQICAPHEMHLGSLRVGVKRRNARKALIEMGYDSTLLENLLWDRVLHLQLSESGKSIIVDKTPNNTLRWQRIHDYWPDARYLILLRHPLRVAQSLATARKDIPLEEHYESVDTFAKAIAAARTALPGLTVRYEHLTADPAAVTQEICRWLDVPWEQAMLEYGAQDHGGYKRGLGDWSKSIRSGKVQPAAPPPVAEEIPAELQKACKRLGYS